MPDFGFVGTSYEAPSIYQDAQECINFYAEIDPTKQPDQRGIVALYPTPGLLLKTQLAVAEVRGLHTMSGGEILIAVSGLNVYSVNTSMVATLIGTLSSNTGPVSISDNITTNNGLTAYIVDGENRYTWVASTNTFAVLPSTDGPWKGASVTDQVDNYFLYNEPGTQNWACSDLGLAFICSITIPRSIPASVIFSMCPTARAISPLLWGTLRRHSSSNPSTS